MNNLINKIFGFIRNESLSISPKTKSLAAVQIGEKWGYIDTTGKIVVQPQFDCAYAFNEAQKATYRDANRVASALNQMKRNAGPIGGVLLEGSQSVGGVIHLAAPTVGTRLQQDGQHWH